MPESLEFTDTERPRERGLVNRLRERIRQRLREQGRVPSGNAGPGARTQG